MISSISLASRSLTGFYQRTEFTFERILFCIFYIPSNVQEEELNWAVGMDTKQRQLFRKMVIDLVLATDMSKHLSLLADIKTTVESSKVAHNGKLVLESYNERMLVSSNTRKYFVTLSQWERCLGF